MNSNYFGIVKCYISTYMRYFTLAISHEHLINDYPSSAEEITVDVAITYKDKVTGKQFYGESKGVVLRQG